LKKTFLQRFINQDEESYTGYWNVRRYIGKDVPPIEMKSSQEMISFVENNSGSIGYIDKASSLAINNSSVKILTY
jgi:ABC-type phosphate transport system substrate-binding protein